MDDGSKFFVEAVGENPPQDFEFASIEDVKGLSRQYPDCRFLLYPEDAPDLKMAWKDGRPIGVVVSGPYREQCDELLERLNGDTEVFNEIGCGLLSYTESDELVMPPLDRLLGTNPEVCPRCSHKTNIDGGVCSDCIDELSKHPESPEALFWGLVRVELEPDDTAEEAVSRLINTITKSGSGIRIRSPEAREARRVRKKYSEKYIRHNPEEIVKRHKRVDLTFTHDDLGEVQYRWDSRTKSAATTLHGVEARVVDTSTEPEEDLSGDQLGR